MDALSKAIDNIIKAAPPLQADDYMGDDGLMYCGKCYARRQMRIELLGEMRTVPVMCDCMKAAMQEEEARERAAVHERKRRLWLQEPADAASTFQRDDRKNPAISDAMRRYADQFNEMERQNMGLLLYGPVGTGKTFYAACIANALIDSGRSAKMTNFSAIINKLQESLENRQRFLDKLNRFDLLIIDDLGIERESEYMQEQVYNIIDARYKARRPLIVTTNISLDEIKNPKNVQRQRIYDRVLQMCFPVKIDGESRRRKSVIATYDERNRLLGL
jgi:DNA replication protein DnaC